MKKALFLCTGNSARSQMAEGLLRHLGGDIYEAFSAGVKPIPIKPLAIDVMAEIGVDISGQRAKSVAEFQGVQFDCVITLCDNAKDTCPVFPGEYKKIHWDLEDPIDLESFRKVRNKIKENTIEFLGLSKDITNLKCPNCGDIQVVRAPKDSCLHFYKCKSCQKVITPTVGSCCVICAYSDRNCPTFLT